MRRWRLAVGAAVAAVILVVAGITLALGLGLDHDAAVRALARATGRDVTIGDGPRLAWGLPPTLVARDVRIGNPAGFSQADMVVIGTARARLDIGALLTGRVVVTRLDLSRADMLAEVAGGVPNWVFHPAPREDAGGNKSPGGGGRAHRFDIREVAVADGRFAYRDAENAGDVTVRTARFLREPDGPRLDAVVSVPGADVTLDAGVTADGVAEATLRALGASATVRGRPDAAGAFDLAATVPDLHALAPLVPGRKLPPWRDITATGHARRTQDGWSLTDLSLTTPAIEARGDATISMAGRPSIRGSLTATKIDIDALNVPSPPTPSPPSGPAPSRSPPAAAPPAAPDAAPAEAAAPRPRRGWPERLRGFDADLAAHVEALTWHGQTDRTVTAHAVLTGGVLIVFPLSADTPAGHADGTLHADASGPTPTVSVTARAPEVPAAIVADALGRPGLIAGPMQADIDLTGTGETPRQQRETARGHLGLAMVGGTVDNALLEASLGQVLRLAHLPDLARAKGRTDVRCFAARMDVADGIGTLRALALETSALDLGGGGTVGLSNGALALRLEPTVRLSGVGGLSVPLLVGGTLAQPEVRAGSAGEGAGLTLGKLGADGRIAGGPPGPDCPAALAIARDGMPGPAPPPAPDPLRRPEDLLKRLIPSRRE